MPSSARRLRRRSPQLSMHHCSVDLVDVGHPQLAQPAGGQQPVGDGNPLGPLRRPHGFESATSWKYRTCARCQPRATTEFASRSTPQSPPTGRRTDLVGPAPVSCPHIGRRQMVRVVVDEHIALDRPAIVVAAHRVAHIEHFHARNRSTKSGSDCARRAPGSVSPRRIPRRRPWPDSPPGSAVCCAGEPGVSRMARTGISASLREPSDADMGTGHHVARFDIPGRVEVVNT